MTESLVCEYFRTLTEFLDGYCTMYEMEQEVGEQFHFLSSEDCAHVEAALKRALITLQLYRVSTRKQIPVPTADVVERVLADIQAAAKRRKK